MKKNNFYSLIFSEILLLLIYDIVKNFIQSEEKRLNCLIIPRPASPIPLQPQNDPTCPRNDPTCPQNISMYFTCKILTFFAVELNRFSINYSFHKRIIRKI